MTGADTGRESGRPAATGGTERTNALPLSVGRPELLVDGGDGLFRRLIYDMFTVSVRMQKVRDAIAERMGLTGPQYTILMAVGQLAGESGVTVTAVAQHLHVSGAFATVEIGKLARLGLVAKTANPDDGRSVLVRLTPDGRRRIESVAADLRAVNDRFFASLDADAFRALAATMAELVEDSENALAHLAMENGRRRAGRDAALAARSA